MLINKNTAIKGENVVLVPYRNYHVPKYHKWMQSPELQQLTASEPLTLEEEYKMQESWLKDENKCTFVVLHKEKYESTQDEVEAMIGDTNLFVATSEDRLCAEAEIMIAEPWARRKKCGWEAMLLMFMYAVTVLGTKKLVVKISFDNEPSIRMFKSMGFEEVGRSEAFREITFIKVVDDLWRKWLDSSLKCYEIVEHE